MMVKKRAKAHTPCQNLSAGGAQWVEVDQEQGLDETWTSVGAGCEKWACRSAKAAPWRSRVSPECEGPGQTLGFRVSGACCQITKSRGPVGNIRGGA